MSGEKSQNRLEEEGRPITSRCGADAGLAAALPLLMSSAIGGRYRRVGKCYLEMYQQGREGDKNLDGLIHPGYCQLFT